MITIKAKFDGHCPQCKEVIPTGSPVAKSKYDKIWRCVPCSAMFEELGPVFQGNYLCLADKEANNARSREIIARYGKTHTFTNPKVNG